MGYSTGLLRDLVTILNRKEAERGKFGLDSAGIEFETAGVVCANVTWAKGKQAMNAGALDVYGVIMVRMRWNTIVTDRSRIVYQGKTYQILGDTFHAQRQDNEIQFHAQLLVNNQ
jgi:SPP1 family predicted phage head-tail adaptor